MVVAKPPPFVPPIGLSRDDAHNYFWRDDFSTASRIASVTKVVGILEKPGLAPGAARITANHAATQLEDVVRLVEAVGIPEAVKKISGIYRAEWDYAADRGSRVHTLAELVLRGKEIQPLPDEVPFVAGLDAFIKDAHPIPLALEEMVAFEDEQGIAYAGTFDAVLQLASGRWLVDFKTGKEIYPETALQLAGYAFASFVGRPGTTQRYEIPEMDLFAVCHLHPSHPKGYAFVPYTVGRREWIAFMSLLDAWEWIHGPGKSKRERMPL